VGPKTAIILNKVFKYEGESHKSLKLHVASGASIFTILLRCCVAFLHRTATCRTLFKTQVSLLSTYRQSSCVSNFCRTFKVFIWLSAVYFNLVQVCFKIILTKDIHLYMWQCNRSVWQRDYSTQVCYIMKEENPPSYWDRNTGAFHKFSQAKHRDVWDYEKIPSHHA